IDGVDIKKINTAFLRSQIGVVGQEPVLFSGTIAENIRFGNPKATQDEIINSAKTANIHSFIEKLPHGYETLLGENGAQLSGGQKQRIAIARAIVRNPRILLLDEATSALDNESERIVQKALDKASEGRTTLIVSHRLSSIQNANYIIVFNQGEIVETGSHEELIQQKGHYFKLRMAGKDSVNSDSCSSSVEDTDQPESERKTNQSDEVDEYFSNDDPDKEHLKIEEANNHMIKIFKMSLMDWKLLAIGCICSLIVGASFPVNGLLFGYFFEVFQTEELDVMRSIALSNLLRCIALAFSAGIAALALTYSFGKAGIHLTTKLRVMYLEKALQQEIRWYDDPGNSVGALSARLSKDCANVQGATGIRISAILQAITSIVIGGAIGLLIFWKYALIILVMVPYFFPKEFHEEVNYCNFIDGVDIKKINTAFLRSQIGVVGQEPVLFSGTITENIRFGNPKATQDEIINSAKTANIHSFIEKLPQGYETLLGENGAQLSGGQKQRIAIARAIVRNPRILLLDEATSALDNESERIVQKALDKASEGRTTLIVSHRLSSIQNANYIVVFNQGEIVETGSHEELIQQKGDYYKLRMAGKIPLIEVIITGVWFVGFALAGALNVNSAITSAQNIMSFLSSQPKLNRLEYGNAEENDQEPVLFDRTIAENIAYGDNSRVVSMEEIIEAAKEAQIHSEFITKLPLGYDTPLGSRGTQLSGGQKQRIAIARALIRNPKVLLLDEATSALDAESEKTVQNALERASENRTCIVIAHRLSTIRNADLICVIDKGQIAEMGTHNDLMSLNGIYYKMYQSSVIVT
uniref:Uncharacterized protein n=1 Tax=Phlebotomus papatasi TaxID=29031 RepID=A0A1B0DGS4_PHLPP